jgi:hypothetical protein
MVTQCFGDLYFPAIEQVNELKRVYDAFPLEMIVRDDECRPRVL